MPPSAPSADARWVTRRSHLQVAASDVLPVIFKARRAAHRTAPRTSVPPAFPPTDVCLADALPAIRSWLPANLEKMYRLNAMNVKPGAFETPDVLRTGIHRFTVWFEPTAATFALVTPQEHPAVSGRSADEANSPRGEYEAYVPTPQTLHIVAELDAQEHPK